MWSMSMLKREENMAKLGATFPLKQMITYEQCMKVGVVLTRLHWINDCKRDKECEVMNHTTDMGEAFSGCGKRDEKGLKDPKRVKD